MRVEVKLDLNGRLYLTMRKMHIDSVQSIFGKGVA
jgi:hypothetical protein